MSLANTIGYGRWAEQGSGAISGGSMFLDRDFDRTAAIVAFQRPPGTRSPDVDPSGSSVAASTGAAE